jgi:hypothetical protein
MAMGGNGGGSQSVDVELVDVSSGYSHAQSASSSGAAKRVARESALRGSVSVGSSARLLTAVRKQFRPQPATGQQAAVSGVFAKNPMLLRQTGEIPGGIGTANPLLATSSFSSSGNASAADQLAPAPLTQRQVEFFAAPAAKKTKKSFTPTLARGTEPKPDRGRRLSLARLSFGGFSGSKRMSEAVGGKRSPSPHLPGGAGQ